MPGATFIQIVKAVMLVVGVAVTAVMVLHRYQWNVDDLLGGAASGSGIGQRFLEPGLRYGGSTTSKLDFFSLQIAIVLGLAALPHVMMRLLAPSATRVLRRSILWAMGLVGFVCLAAGVLGLGATAIVGRDVIADIDAKGDAAVLLLAQDIGGALLTALISCLAFVTLLAVAAGLTLAAASSLAHDLYAEVIRKGPGKPAGGADRGPAVRRRDRCPGDAARARLLGDEHRHPGVPGLRHRRVADLPTIVSKPFWRRFNARGALLSLYGGLITSVLLVVCSPARLLEARLVLPRRGLRLLPAAEPGHRLRPGRVPAGLAGHRPGPRPEDTEPSETYEKFEVRAVLGVDQPV